MKKNRRHENDCICLCLKKRRNRKSSSSTTTPDISFDKSDIYFENDSDSAYEEESINHTLGYRVVYIEDVVSPIRRNSVSHNKLCCRQYSDNVDKPLFHHVFTLFLKYLRALVLNILICASLLCISLALILAGHFGRNPTCRRYSAQLDFEELVPLLAIEDSHPARSLNVTEHLPQSLDLPTIPHDRSEEPILEPVKSLPEEHFDNDVAPVKTSDDRYIVKAVPKEIVDDLRKDRRDAATDTAEVVQVPFLNDSAVPDEEDKNVTDAILPPVENVTDLSDDLNVTSTPQEKIVVDETNKTEGDIPSFREWTQKALEEEEKKQEEERRRRDEEREKKKQHQILQNSRDVNKVNKTKTWHSAPHQHTTTQPVRLKKNFASPDCGAKIVAANPEAQGASNVLSAQRDDYLLNKCSDRAWFVVELCESIKALKVELGNFELYSSVPKNFRVSLGNAFPTRDKDWAVFGSFEAEDDRNLQAFTAVNGEVFGKFVKVEVLSHHGSEHYCPISQFKIFGISEIELMGGDDDDDDDDVDPVVSTPVPSTEENNIVLKFIKEKVGQTLEKFVGVFNVGEQYSSIDMAQAMNKSSLVGTSFAYEISCPECPRSKLSDVYFLLTTNFQQMSAVLKTTNIGTALEGSSVCQSYGVPIQGAATRITPNVGHSLLAFYSTLFGDRRIIALCNVILIEQGLGKKIQRDDADVKTKSEDGDGLRGNSEAEKSDENSNNKLELPSLEPSRPSVEKADSSSSVADSQPGATLDVAGGKPQVGNVTIDDSQLEAAAVEKDPISPTPIVDSPTKMETPFNIETEMRDLPDVVLVPPSDHSHITSDNVEDTTTGNGNRQLQNGHGGRESVWQKLANRIKTLERNVSLSSRYLEELSVLYKKQIEDLQLSMRQVSDSLASTVKARENDQLMIKHLQNEVSVLSDLVSSLTIKFESLTTLAVIAHIFVLVLEILLGGVFLFACYRKLRCYYTAAPAQIAPEGDAIISPVNGLPPVASTPLKRGHSLEDLTEERTVKSELNKSLKRRMSLDNLTANGRVRNDQSRKQRRRLQRRLSAAKNNDFVINQISKIDELSVVNRDDREWTPVRRGGSIDRTSPPPLEIITSLPNGQTFMPFIKSSLPSTCITTSNSFGILNNSVHDDPTPLKERALNSVPLRNGTAVSSKKLKFSQEIHHKPVEPADSHLLLLPKAHRAGHVKRSKSTSPTRSKNQSTKQRELFKQFNPDTAEWIKQ